MCTLRDSKNLITKWINDKFNQQRTDKQLPVPPPTKIRGNHDVAMQHVFRNNNIPVNDLLEKDHVALLYPNTYFNNMREEIIRDDK